MSGNDSNYMDGLFSSGIINTALMAILAYTINCISTSLFVRSWRFESGNHYPDIVKEIFGHGRTIIRLIYILTLLYSAICNFSAVNYYYSLLGSRFADPQSHLNTPWIPYYLIIPVFTIPFCFVNRFVNLKYWFFIGNIGLLLVLATTIYFAATNIHEKGFDPENSKVLISWDFWGMVNSYSYFTTLLWGQPFLCEIARYAKKARQHYIISFIYVSSALVVVFNFAIAILSHFYFWGSA
ncbi:hypothetical protein TVAG_218670 [Trichomonas vaginalis G3]|uniref:Uncharacterized protein n=1 Tax=Trichomonas vaginalis (strain ATCC PRA-98 / G3) TaxID=412133 RepID=A2GAN0_TRIV3|nr:transmembrane amino acid transporter protein family [Trichomonas vaginalis G3]EAX85782.1 hypothetical protein TVAG_218670 [Trichomonas vaginalis G3]KAI5538471.1 transmembrane amino acid transporter protein family [Trichomonas vaginalis G3]|eukprot:XP_001298712.1 hypothetical protein [Trichomonas vaginalis G3]